jgi:hypothetical protein
LYHAAKEATAYAAADIVTAFSSAAATVSRTARAAVEATFEGTLT